MAYNPTKWKNDTIPAINAPHLNNIEDELVSVDTRTAHNEILIHNLQAGGGASIKGTKALNEIYQVHGNINDIYISSTTPIGHGFISDGVGAGAGHWKDVGMLRGQQGLKGDKGDRGEGLHILSTQTDLAAIKALPNPQEGDIHIAADTSIAWAYNAVTKVWHNVGTIVGLKGDKGDMGQQGLKGDTGAQGQAGGAVNLATEAETIAGVVNNKAVTPRTAAVTYLSLKGGQVKGTIAIVPGVNNKGLYVYAKNATNKYSIKVGTNSAGAGEMFSAVGASRITLENTGDISITPKAGKSILMPTTLNIGTPSQGELFYSTHSKAFKIQNKGGSCGIWFDDTGDVEINPKTGNNVVTNGELNIHPTDDSSGLYIYAPGQADYKLKVGYNTKGVSIFAKASGASITMSDVGNISLDAKAGKEVRIGGQNGSIVTGSLSGTTLTLSL